MKPCTDSITGGIDVPQDQPFHGCRGALNPGGNGPRPTNLDPIGGTEPADQRPIGLELRPAPRGQLTLPLSDFRGCQDHASGWHRVDGKNERLLPGLDLGASRATNSEQMAAGVGIATIAFAPPASIETGIDFPSSVTSMSRAKATGITHENGPGPKAASSSSVSTTMS